MSKKCKKHSIKKISKPSLRQNTENKIALFCILAYSLSLGKIQTRYNSFSITITSLLKKDKRIYTAAFLYLQVHRLKFSYLNYNSMRLILYFVSICKYITFRSIKLSFMNFTRFPAKTILYFLLR